MGDAALLGLEFAMLCNIRRKCETGGSKKIPLDDFASEDMASGASS